jgi:hypothetical protein
MVDDLDAEYPEAAPYIRQAVNEHSEQWVIENYHPKITQLGVVMNIPAVEELPFYDERNHEALSEQEKQDRADAYRSYRENLRTGTKPDEE